MRPLVPTARPPPCYEFRWRPQPRDAIHPRARGPRTQVCACAPCCDAGLQWQVPCTPWYGSAITSCGLKTPGLADIDIALTPGVFWQAGGRFWRLGPWRMQAVKQWSGCASFTLRSGLQPLEAHGRAAWRSAASDISCSWPAAASSCVPGRHSCCCRARWTSYIYDTLWF